MQELLLPMDKFLHMAAQINLITEQHITSQSDKIVKEIDLLKQYKALQTKRFDFKTYVQIVNSV